MVSKKCSFLSPLFRPGRGGRPSRFLSAGFRKGLRGGRTGGRVGGVGVLAAGRDGRGHKKTRAGEPARGVPWGDERIQDLVMASAGQASMASSTQSASMSASFTIALSPIAIHFEGVGAGLHTSFATHASIVIDNNGHVRSSSEFCPTPPCPDFPRKDPVTTPGCRFKTYVARMLALTLSRSRDERSPWKDATRSADVLVATPHNKGALCSKTPGQAQCPGSSSMTGRKRKVKNGGPAPCRKRC